MYITLDFRFESCQLKDSQVIPDFCMSTTRLLTIQGLHSSSGRQKTRQMLSPKPLSHSIQQQMRFLTFTKKKKEKRKTVLNPFFIFEELLHTTLFFKKNDQ